MRLSASCTLCSKPLQLQSECKFGAGFLRTYKCGHAFYDSQDTSTHSGHNGYNFTSLTGTKEAFDFQKDGIEFIIKSNFNCLVADPMGLGKTIQALLAAREAKLSDGTPRFKTILTIVKPSTVYQWFHESKEWLDTALWSSFIVQGTKGFIPPGFRTYIISMDTLSRYAKSKSGLKTIQDLGIDLVIVDECHSFKNPDSARSQALVAFLQGISKSEIEREITLVCNLCHNGESKSLATGNEWNGEWTEKATIKYDIRTNRSGTLSYRHSSECPKCHSRVAVYQDRIVLDERERNKGLVMLSGTPIENRAEEYFVPLNLLMPDRFSSLAGFRRNWLAQDSNGKYNRIASWKLEQFRELTSSFIIRRNKLEVLKDLPLFRREFCRIGIEDSGFKDAYNKALDELQKRVDELAAEGREMGFFEVEANLMTLRRIVGMAKVPSALEYVESFLEQEETEKLAIGIHHEGVRDTLYFSLKTKGIKCLKLSGEDSAQKKDEILRQFRSDPDIRVIIINMLAGGTGLNIQEANNILVLERQWNASKEEQFEGRFWRQGQTLPVLADYMIAEGIPTEDFFTAMVEEKRQICGESLDGWSFSQDAEAVRELVYKSLETRLK